MLKLRLPIFYVCLFGLVFLSLSVFMANAQTTQETGERLYSAALKEFEIAREGGIRNARRIWDAAIKPHNDVFKAAEAKAQADYKTALSDAETLYNTRIVAANALTNATAKANAIREAKNNLDNEKRLAGSVRSTTIKNARIVFDNARITPTNTFNAEVQRVKNVFTNNKTKLDADFKIYKDAGKVAQTKYKTDLKALTEKYNRDKQALMDVFKATQVSASRAFQSAIK